MDDEKYIYDIDFEDYVNKIVNSDDENKNKKNISNVIIVENDIYDRDNINYFYSNHSKKVYNKGSIYTNKNNFNRNYFNNRNDSVKIIKRVSFNDETNMINNTKIFKEDSPKSIVNLNEHSDDVRNKRFEDFIPKGKYVYNKNNFNY